ncbi:DUF5691 domain-containing protein [Mucilaginibacter paludis]|uniref:Uncharacterized protein n=1 Tax=Mucilaginibacter paludis DSM 18603 TaxID=714943 RepID=H1YD73_9SPHI|nr:DUF5691 domain-containing protein [Mucilaginibacter paludis]EHQ27099.1 hypothetical protein Mucpa_2992 [Mucilaginibacter paludis DSM 18603]
MKAWEHIINTAMLGTDKPFPGVADLPEDVAVIAGAIDTNEDLDKELKFLQKAAVIYNYRQCGFVAMQKNDLPLNAAGPETKPYCSGMAASVLNNILEEDNISLLEFWLTQCSKSNQLFLPDVLPSLLDKAQKQTALQPLVIACGGNRGEWLGRLNPAWNYFTVLPDEELWQTGRPEDRAKALTNTRRAAPDRAREWLQQTWPQENAASKAELLKILKINSSAADLPWLESLLNEKAQKVKDEVMALLKQIPGSSIVRQYEELLSQSVILKREKALLGMMTKISIQLKLPAKVDESIFKSGIQKLTGIKSTMTDEEYIIYQLISAIPPVFWEQQFEMGPEQVVQHFAKYAPSMVGALGMAVSLFKAESWMRYFLQLDGFYVDFINYLDPPEQEKYLLRLMNSEAKDAIHYALLCNQEWGLTFTAKAVQYMANYPYQYNRTFFNQHIGLIPIAIISQVEKIEPTDANIRQTWEKSKHHLIKLLTLKQQTLRAFNA